MLKYTIVSAAAITLAASANASVLWNNGGMVTHPGQGAGGADVSMASPSPFNSGGSNARHIAPGDHFRIADDFTVTGPGWFVSSIVVHAYETNAAVPTWTQANLNLWNGSPDDAGSSIIATLTTTSWEWTGIYRVFNGLGNLTNTARPVFALTFDLGDLPLLDGTYWIDWQLEGGASGWAPFVMEPDPAGGVDTITVFGNGLQLASGGWQPLLADPGAETPFIVNGSIIPAPGALALLGLAGLVGVRRRRN